MFLDIIGCLMILSIIAIPILTKKTGKKSLLLLLIPAFCILCVVIFREYVREFWWQITSPIPGGLPGQRNLGPYTVTEW